MPLLRPDRLRRPGRAARLTRRGSGGSVPAVIVVSPHLDDAILSCYGVLSPAAAVITVLAGFPSRGILGAWDAQGGCCDSRARVAQRREEDRRALTRSGATPIHLDFPDRQYVTQGGVSRPTVEIIAASLREHLVGAATVFAPSALSASKGTRLRKRRLQSDHQLVRDAVLSVRPDAVLYADLPYALSRDRGFALPRDADRPTRREHRLQLSEQTVAEKIASVCCYESQLDQLIQIFGDFVNRDGLGLEVWWDKIPTI